MLFRQILREDTSCASYLVGCQSKVSGAIIDPQLEVEQYVALAEKTRVKITHVIDTHIHADHQSGARRLGELTGASIYLHESAKVNFDFTPLRDGDEFRVGNRRIRVIHSPGHTPESMSLMVDGRLVLTGDTLFVGDVGRLDLAGAGTPEQLYSSLFDKLLKLDDLVEVYPGHYGKSLCGKGLEEKPSSTIGFERKYNYALKASSMEDFVKFVAASPHPLPPNYLKIKKLNRGES